MSMELLASVCNADDALARLLSGNERFVSGRPQPRRSGADAELVPAQRPGNVALPAVMGSIQYAGVHLRTPLFMILGHEGCGAVSAALNALHQGSVEKSRIQLLVESIKPGLEAIPADTPPEELLRNGVEANVRWSMRQLLDTPEGRQRFAEGPLKLVGGVYELTTGRVRLLD
jgi:carbonic anhydrase